MLFAYWFGFATSLFCSVLKSGSWFVLKGGHFYNEHFSKYYSGVIFRRIETPPYKCYKVLHYLCRIKLHGMGTAHLADRGTIDMPQNVYSVVMYIMCTNFGAFITK